MEITFISNLLTSSLYKKNVSFQNQKIFKNTVKKPNRTIKNLISNYNTYVMNFLASGRTYSMYDRERINFTHVTKDVAEQNTIENLDKEKPRKLKPKVNHGKF